MFHAARVEGRAPAALVVPGGLEIVALPCHADRNPPDASSELSKTARPRGRGHTTSTRFSMTWSCGTKRLEATSEVERASDHRATKTATMPATTPATSQSFRRDRGARGQ